MNQGDMMQLASRLYRGGFKLEDFTPSNIRAGFVIVTPLRPPSVDQVKGRVIDAAEVFEVRGEHARAYVVVMASDKLPPGALPVECGDVVTLCNAQLDPLTPEGDIFAIRAVHIYHRWPTDHVEPSAAPLVVPGG